MNKMDKKFPHLYGVLTSVRRSVETLEVKYTVCQKAISAMKKDDVGNENILLLICHQILMVLLSKHIQNPTTLPHPPLRPTHQ